MNNPNYIPYSQQERHWVIDATIESCVEALHIPAIAERLGSRTIELLTILNHMTVPNIRNGYVIHPNTDDDRTLVIALHDDEAVRRYYQDMSFNALQKQALAKLYGQDIAQEAIDVSEDYYYKTPEKTVDIGSLRDLNIDAHVATSRLPIDTIHGAMILIGRPLVIFSADDKKKRSPPFALHEFYHAHQVHNHPLIDPDEDAGLVNTENELEAYHVSAQIIRGYEAAGMHRELQISINETMRNRMLRIDEIRQAHQDDTTNPFAANEKIAADLAAHQLSIVHAS